MTPTVFSPQQRTIPSPLLPDQLPFSIHFYYSNIAIFVGKLEHVQKSMNFFSLDVIRALDMRLNDLKVDLLLSN